MTGDAGNNTFDASGISGAPIHVVFHGGGGDDLLIGGAGDDLLDGGANTDTARVAGTIATSTTTYTTTNGIVTGFTSVSGAGGNDTLTGIEKLVFDNNTAGNTADDVTLDLGKAVQLFNSGGQLIGTFDQIQDAIVAADTSGETIKVKAGTYDENVNVNKTGLTIIGAVTRRSFTAHSRARTRHRGRPGRGFPRKRGPVYAERRTRN